MPAILLEPCFVSNPTEATMVRSTAGLVALASALVETIKRQFPNGGLIAFSVGHKGKESSPHDMGAAVVGGGTEAEFAEKVLTLANTMLTGEVPKEPDPVITLPAGDNEFTEREKMALAIIDFEARKDKNGNLTVYKLPVGDGGGSYEVAGINDKYHPKEAAKLKSFIDRGMHKEALSEAASYLASYTDVATTWFTLPDGSNNSHDFPAIEFFLRDSVFNRGAGGAAKILQIALGVDVDGGVGNKTKEALQKVLSDDWKVLLNKLRASREVYERSYVHRNESSIFWKGLVNRWNKAVEKGLSFA